jgi:glutaminyl-tRNA synthetase
VKAPWTTATHRFIRITRNGVSAISSLANSFGLSAPITRKFQQGIFSLVPGNKVRLKYGHVIECTGANKDANGQVTEVLAQLIPDTKSGTPDLDSVKVKGVITWVSQADAVKAEVRLYDRLFTEANPDAGGKDFLSSLNPDSLKVIEACVEPSVASSQPDQKFQFERHGYFVADRLDHSASKPVFNRSTGLKDTWSK